MRIAYPAVLLLIPAFLALLVLTRRRLAARRSTLLYPGTADVRRLGQGKRARLWRILPTLRVVSVLLGIVALSRPQSGEHEEKVVSEGIDIVLAIDVSGSMKAEDFQPQNRLEVAKTRARDFIMGRSGDRIGLVIFAADAYTKCPLTRDYGVLAGIVDRLSFDDVGDPNATAIGMAIATAANRLKDSEAESKIIILLTDGLNNSGAVDPITAAKLCQSLDIKVYTIGVGSEGKAPFPDTDMFGRKRYVYLESSLDEAALTEVAQVSGGLYFRATDPESLRRIYERISEMEKTEIETQVYVRYAEAGPVLVLIALIMLIAEAVLSQTFLFRLVE